MKKIYYILPLALAAGMFSSCSNDLAGTEEMLPIENVQKPESDITRAFPEDDGAKALSGMPAEKLWALLPGADSTFATTSTAFEEMTSGMYNEIKEFADALIAKEKNPSVARIHRVLFDWIVKNIKYADGYCSNEPYDVFTTKKAVCQGYANLLTVMARTQGLHIITVNGIFGAGHAWNYVQLNNGDWWVSDPTNNILIKGEKLDEYKNRFFPLSAVGNIYENDQIAVNFSNNANLNLSEIKVAGESYMVPFSVTLNDESKFQITSFDPSVDLPETIKEIYLGKNIQSLGESALGLRTHAANLEAMYVDPDNQFLESHNGIVYQVYNDEPVYIPTAMKSVTLKFTETIGKNYLYNHQGVEEFHVPAGTKKLEDWAVEKCPNLKVAYIPVDTEVSEKAFVDCHPDFQIIRQDQTGIKDVIAD
jgi:hypothetical protein